MKKNYLVTGAAGFIGSHLAEKLLAQPGISVTGIDNFDPFYPKELKEKNLEFLHTQSSFTFIEGDIRDTSWHSRADEAGPYDGIFHIAAKAGVIPSINNPIGYEDVNIKGTLQLLEFARNRQIRQFVFASSSSIYGINTNVPWSEDDYVLKPISPYASSKVACELAGHTYCILYNMRFIALRFFTVFGPRQRPDLAIHKFIHKILNDEPIQMYGDGSTRRDYTFVGDITDGLLAAGNYSDSAYEIINLGNNHPVTLTELIMTIEKVTGKKALIQQLPEQPGDVPVTFADIRKAGSLLNYKPKVSLEEGISVFHKWYLANH